MSLAKQIADDVLEYLHGHGSGVSDELDYLRTDSEESYNKLQTDLENKVQSHLDNARQSGQDVGRVGPGEEFPPVSSSTPLEQGPPADQEQPQPEASEESPPQG